MASALIMNPRKKRRRTTRKRRTTTRRKNPVRRGRRASTATRRRRTYRRRNPKMLGGIGKDLVPAAIGAGGALGLDVALSVAPLPAMMKSGPVGLITKYAGALALGFIAKNTFATKRMSEQITAGALTVITYGAAKSFIQQNVPQIPLNEYISGTDLDYYDPALGYVNAGMSAGSGSDETFDFYSPSAPMPAYSNAEPEGMGEYISGYGYGYQ